MLVKDELIKISLKDLRAAQLLFENKLYCQSFYLFQQASEKANKAYGLSIRVISDIEIKRINHKQLEIYKLMLKANKKEYEKITQLLSEHPTINNHRLIKKIDFANYGTILENGIQFFKSIKEDSFLNHSQSELNFYLNTIEDLCFFKFKIGAKEKKVNFNELLPLLEDYIVAFGTVQMKSEISDSKTQMNKEELISIFESLAKHQMQLSFVFLTFFFCGIITVQHNNRPRYPLDNTSPLKLYTKSNPIVRNQAKFMFYLEKAIQLFKKYESLAEL